MRFWFNPDWNGGTGPGAPGYLSEMGDVYSPGGGWALETHAAGTGFSLAECGQCLTMSHLGGAFWFNPDWNGGTGKGAPDYWFELWDVYSPGGGWALARDPAGTRRSSR